MRGLYHGHVITFCIAVLLVLAAAISVNAQQNTTLFFMHSLPEANFINPAVQGDCGVFLGFPLISSFHLNIANSGFTAGDVMVLYTDGGYGRRNDYNTETMARRNYFISEMHATLLAFGLLRDKKYYTFTITEKNNLSGIYTRDLTTFALRGAAEFEGHEMDLRGTGLAFNHLREYAFGIAKKQSSSLQTGWKVKLLFGKYNLETDINRMEVFVEDNTRDLIINLDGGYNSSMPGSLRLESDGTYSGYRKYDASLVQQLMNARNPGLAIDAGFIYDYSDRITFSGSLLDVGLIWYTSNLTNYKVQGTDRYQGPFGTGPVDDQYLWDVFDDVNTNMTAEVTYKPYIHFLDPKLYLGASWHINNRYDASFLLYNRLLPGKLQTGYTISGLAGFGDRLEASISWSYINKSFSNLGLGFRYGKKPLQLYFVTDNVLGFVLPMNTKSINVRLGINLILGCTEQLDMDQCGCEWLRKAQESRLRRQDLRQRMKRQRQ